MNDSHQVPKAVGVTTREIPLSTPQRSLSLITWAEIDLAALRANVRAIQEFVGPRVEIFAVVKANAYGHGAVPVARAALAAGATRLAVHRVDEGVELREAGIDAPILLLGYAPLSAAPLVARYRLTPTVNTLEFAEALAAYLDEPLPVHIKVDTGLGRYGLLPQEVVDFARALDAMSHIVIEGVYTHFATADEADASYMRRQFGIFRDVLSALEAAGIRPILRHACNSAATFAFPQAHLDAVRPGIALYGLRPSDAWEPPVRLRPVLTLKSRVARVRTLPAGSSIGYGRTFTADKPIRVALVPIGYGDGYHRVLSNRAQVLIRGKRARMVGRVSMDQIVVDVTHIPGVQIEDEVVLIGEQGGEAIRAEEVARWAQTINYEVTTSLLPRVTRIYLGE